jgi:hypothetical protein
MKNQELPMPDLLCFDCASHGPVLTPYEGGYICEDCSERYRVGRDNTTRAVKAQQRADRLGSELVVMQLGDQQPPESLEYAAQAAKHMAEVLHEPIAHVQIGTGGEVVQQNKLDMLNTLSVPTLVAMDASSHRTDLITAIGGSVAAMALDAAQTIQAANSIEKMLAHQMAAIHDAGMRAMQRANITQDAAQATKLINASTRCFDTFQRAAVTLDRLRGKQEQRILVQHVNVGQGAQAVIGNIQTGVGGSL